MELSETATLLAYVQAFDNRTIDASDPDAIPVEVMAWHDVLSDYPFDDCREAVRLFFKTETGWLMPGDVYRLMKKIRADRAYANRKRLAVEATKAIESGCSTRSEPPPEFSEWFRKFKEGTRIPE